MIIVIFGPPAVGKGTQATYLSRTYNIPHLSTGAMLRAAVAAGTRVGRRAGSIMAKGGLVPDRVILQIVTGRIAEPDCANGFILDGVPRTVVQAKALDRLLRRTKRRVDAVVVLEADEDELVTRVEKRAADAKANGEPVRSDDDPEVFKRRLAAYKSETAPVLPYYDRQRKVARVNAMRSADEVSAAIVDALIAMRRRKPWYARWFGLLFEARQSSQRRFKNP
ncbi:MAG: adenylate kinase [Micropepsaceae bacterium]